MKKIYNYRFNIFLIGVFLFGFISIFMGLKNLINLGVDCQIEGAHFFVKNLSPYSKFIEDANSFRFSRYPTLLPQGYVFLSLFTFLPEKVSYLLFGVIGILIAFLFCYKYKKSYFILFLLFGTLSYRNNLGNGQIGFFLFSIFLFFDILIKSKNNWVLYMLCPLLLCVISSKPTLFFWVPFYIGFNKKNLVIYFITFCYIIFLSYFFAFYVNQDIRDVFTDYIYILKEHGGLMHDNANVFAVDFKFSILSIISNIFKFLLVVAIIVTFYNYYKKNVSEPQYMFSWILISFLVVYHRFYDLFLLMIPILKFYDKERFQSSLFKYFVIIMIIYNVTSVYTSNQFNDFLYILLLISITLVYLPQGILKKIEYKILNK